MINRFPTLSEVPERFFLLPFCFRPVHGLQVRGEGLPIILPPLVEGIAYGVKHKAANLPQERSFGSLPLGPEGHR